MAMVADQRVIRHVHVVPDILNSFGHHIAVHQHGNAMVRLTDEVGFMLVEAFVGLGER